MSDLYVCKKVKYEKNGNFHRYAPLAKYHGEYYGLTAYYRRLCYVLAILVGVVAGYAYFSEKHLPIDPVCEHALAVRDQNDQRAAKQEGFDQ